MLSFPRLPTTCYTAACGSAQWRPRARTHPGSGRSHVQDRHHAIVLVLEDMAMEHALARHRLPDLDRRRLLDRDQHGVDPGEVGRRFRHRSDLPRYKLELRA